MDDNIQKLEVGLIAKLVGAISIEGFRKILIKNLIEVFTSSHKNTNAEFGFRGTTVDPRAIDYLRERTIILSDKTAAKLQGDLKFELIEALKNNESIGQITKRLDKIFTDMMPWQLERIARTESLNAMNSGRMSAYQQSGVVEYKMWKAAVKNPRTAADSKRLNGQIQKLEDPFVDPKTGESFMHPPNRPQCRCLYENPLIYTVDGWKPIAKITIGDLVLTHKGRFRNVTEIHKNSKKESRYKITLFYDKYSKSPDSLMTLTVTPDHPFMTDRGWVEAQNLNYNDKIQVIADICDNCGEIYPKLPNGIGEKQYYNYCSMFCAQSYTAKDQWENTDMREIVGPKISVSMKEQYASGERSTYRSPEHLKALTEAGIAIFKSPENRAKNWVFKPKEETIRIRNSISIGTAKWREDNPELWEAAKLKMSIIKKELYKNHPEKHPNYIMAQKGHESLLEKLMKGELENRDIKFTKQEHIDKFWVDFAIPDLKIAIECDGEYWHQDKEKEINRDNIIKSYGWDILHFTGEQIINDVNICVDSIERLMKNHNDEYNFMWLPIKNILITEPPKIARMTWNLSVEEDESFVAKSMVVHNCTVIPLRKLPDNVIRASGQMYAGDQIVGKLEIPIDLLKSQEKRKAWVVRYANGYAIQCFEDEKDADYFIETSKKVDAGWFDFNSKTYREVKSGWRINKKGTRITFEVDG